MKQLISIFLILAGTLLATQLPAQNNGNLHKGIKPIGSNSNITLAFLDEFITSQMESYNISGMSASVVTGDRIAWSKSYGLANRETGMEVTDSTLFILLSTSKMFTGLTMMQLYEKGLFGLDDNINDYLPFEYVHPNYPDRTITFRMLMTHTAGLYEPFSLIESLMSHGTDPTISLHDFLEGFFTPGGTYYSTSYFSPFEPGTQFAYSNVGATLGGYLAEVIAGIPFNELCKDSLLSQIGMPNSSFLLADIDTANLAMIYDYYGSSYHPLGHISNPTLPAGFLRTSNRQMANYLLTLINDGNFEGNQVVQSATIDTMTKSHIFPGQNIGLFFGYDPNFQTWGHAGGYKGQKTMAFYNKEENWGISLLTNGDGYFWDIAFMLEQYAREFTALSLSAFNIDDENENQLLEANEKADLVIGFRNAMQHSMEGVKVILRSHHEDIEVIDSIFNITSINQDEVIDNQENPFRIMVHGDGSYREIILEFIYLEGEEYLGSEQFPVYTGQPGILLIDDEENAQRNISQSMTYYKEVLDDSGQEYYFRNMTLSPIDEDFVNQFQKVIWLTGIAGTAQDILPAYEQEILAAYLDQGGNLLLSSQNAGDCCGNTSFFTDYLKVNHIQNSYTGTLYLQGSANDTIGHDLSFALTGGTGNSSSFSPSVVEAVDEGLPVFNYINTDNICGVRFGGLYKSLFLPWGIESVGLSDARYDILTRTLTWFDDPTVGMFDMQEHHAKAAIHVYPNPCVDVLNIEIGESIPEGSGMMEIHDLTGRVLVAEKIRIIPQISVSIRKFNLPSGRYILRLSSEKTGYSQMIIVVK